MIYIFDKTQAIIKVLTNDDFTAAHLNFKINTATTFEFSLPASKALPSDSKFVATPHPLNNSKFIMLRLTERVDNTETIDYSAYELAYQELATDGYIEDKRPQNQSALNLMKIALDGSNWELNNVNVSGTATTNFYYVDHLSAISNVVDLLGGEIVFYIEIQGNAISGRYMDYLARQGTDTSKVFASGSNLLTVERQSDTSNIYTAILPRGKGEEIDDGEADTPDGYGRRINIADVEWKKSAGNPLDKPKGSIVLSDQDATAEWGQINGNARLLLQTYDDIDDVNVLINSAYKTLQSVNHPQIQYSATVADVGGLSLGDTVLIMHGDRDLSYKTRVFEVKYDLLAPDQTELSLGDDLSSNSITSQINSLNAVADTTSSQTQWTINQIGRPSTTFGNTEPANPKVGDVFFKELPDGGTEIYRWNGDIWELLASPTTADDIAAAVDDAVAQAKSHTDEVKQSLSSDIATAKSQAASQASTAEANAKSAATSQFTQAQSDLVQAKTDITNAYKTADGVVNKKIDDTASSITTTINQNKQDADGKISTAQTTATTALNGLSSKVSQTDYDAKTGQLTTSVSKAQQTADTVTTSLGNYKQDADGRISANSADIITNANAIKQKVAQSDYDANNTKLTSRLTTVETTANGTATTVSNLQQTVNNLGQLNRLLNTEFNPDYAAWTAYGNVVRLAIDKYWLQNGSNNLGVNRDQDQSNWGYATQKIAIGQNTTFSFSVNAKINSMISSKGRLYIHLRALDVNGNVISDIYKSGDRSTTNNFEKFSIQNAQTPAGTNVVELAMGMYGGGSVSFNHPFFVLDSHIGNYVAGNYSNSDYLAQVKITADSISNFVRDSSGNISSDFQTALSKTSIITGSALATSIQTQTSSQITSALTDNNGKIISLINQDSSGVQIAGKNLAITADTTVDGNFWAKQVNAVQVNASNITVGTLNGSQVNITNINANNIVSGAISGANLDINLNTGSVVFQKGRINSSDYTTDINIDQGYISTANGDTRALLTQGKLQLIDPTFFSPQTNPYLEISNRSGLWNGMGALVKARDSLTLTLNGYDDRNYDVPITNETFVGISIGKTINGSNSTLMPTKIGGAEQGVVISGGAPFSFNSTTGKKTPFIYVGTNNTGSDSNGDGVVIRASYFYSPSTYIRTSSSSSNVVVGSYGELLRSASARKYKLDIKNDISIADSLKLIDVPLSTWVDKHEHEENGSNERYFGMIAEDLRDAGLEYLVQYGDDNEVEGINYDRVALLLIPLVKELKERIEELESKGK